MSALLPTSLAHVAHVEVLRGRDASPEATPDLLVEVPHGADRRAHYVALRERLVGDLPQGLEIFFHVNTDVGAWQYGRAAAEAVLEAAPQRSALLVRSLIPRTFIDCNRPADFAGGDLGRGGVTAGTHSYVKDARDLALLNQLHQAYVKIAEHAFAAVCGNGGAALVPHTYAPRSIGIDDVGDDIVEKLRWAYEPERYATWPVRAEVDLLTRTGEGELLGPEIAERELMSSFTSAGFAPVANDTYFLHPATLGFGWSQTYPGRVLCLEVRRDLLVESWEPFVEQQPCAERVARIARVLSPALEHVLAAVGSSPTPGVAS